MKLTLKCTIVTFALAIAGCAAQGGAVSAQKPKVEDCGIVAISSPPKYACHGKVYTAFQLAQLRAEAAKKYASGR